MQPTTNCTQFHYRCRTSDKHLQSGASIPLWDHDAFSLCFRFSPLFSKNVKILWVILPFPEKNFRFSSTKISDDLFFSHRPQILNFPLFCLFYYISPLIRKNYYFPLLSQISPPVFGKFTSFLHTFCVFFPPYFDHDAFMHHPMHVLDAPEYNNRAGNG